MAGLPSLPSASTEPDWIGLAGEAEERAERWIAALRVAPAEPALLGDLGRDPESFEFTRRLLELVAGTEDPFASALGLREMSREVPESMPVRDRLSVRAGGLTSLGLPWAVMPVARRRLRERLGELVLATKLPSAAASPGGAGPGGSDRGRSASTAVRLNGLAEALRRHTERGLHPVVVPLGGGVHGPAGVEAEASRLAALAAHPAVVRLTVDPARLAPGGSDWSAEDDVVRAARTLGPVLEAAAEHGTTILVEPRSVRWARLVPDVLSRALADPALDRARVGARLIAELPESREHYDRLSRWAQRRVADGGAPSEVVIGVSGLAGSESTASIQSGLAVPVIEDSSAVTAQLLRLTELALHAGRAASLRPVIASEDVRVLAAAALLAERRGVSELYSVQVRSGVAPGLAGVLAKDHAEVRIALPVISPREFGGAVDLLVGLAAEASDPESAVSRFDRLRSARGEDPESAGPDPESAASDAFRAAALRSADPAPLSRRTQLRAREWDPSERDSALFYRPPAEPARFDTGGLTAAVLGLGRGETGELQLEAFAPPRTIPAVSDSGFANEPETDASVPANREWARELLHRAAVDADERDAVNETVALSPADLDPAISATAASKAGVHWGQRSHRDRAACLRRAALAVVAARDRLLQTLAVDTGAPIGVLDAEVNDIVDAARYCGQLAEGLAAVRGATFAPDRLVLVTADAGTSLSAQAGAVLSALAGGSGVLWAVPQRVYTSAAALVEEWEAAGLPAGTARLEAVAMERTLPELAAEPGIDRAVVLGDPVIARELARRRPSLRIDGRFRARGSILVTPSIDIDLAIPDVVASALHAPGLRTAGAVVLLGGATRSRRFIDGLTDAVRGLRVGDTARPGDADLLSFDLGPLPAPPGEAALRALTGLGRGEEWLVQPRQLDSEGRLWSPGLRVGVSPTSTFWDDALGVPVIGVTHAHTMSEALAFQNAAGGGAVAGLQSNDAEEILEWLDGVSAASLSINRPTTAARVERQPGGGWDEAATGMSGLSGGPNWLVDQGSWRLREGTRSETLHLRGLEPEVRLLIETAQGSLSYEDFDGVRRAALADALAWRTTFGTARDRIGLGIERNVLRYSPVVTQVRLAEGGPLAALVRVLAAALVVRAPVSVSTGEVLPSPISDVLTQLGVEVSLERDDDWLERLAVSGPLGPEGLPASRVRLIGGARERVAEWMSGRERVALWAEPVTMAGPVELLTMLREQSVSARAHRHGLAVPVPGLDELVEA